MILPIQNTISNNCDAIIFFLYSLLVHLGAIRLLLRYINMNSYIKRFNNNAFEISPKAYPFKETIKIYQGDELSISFKAINLDSEKTPFNFDVFDSFQACFKLSEASSEVYCATENNFILDQTDYAISFDANNGNPSGTTKDELHFLDPSYTILKDYRYNRVFFDIQGKIGDSVYTLIKFNGIIENQITE